MRLIDADALKEFAKEKCSYCTSFIGEENVLSWIDKAPTIDPDELDMLESMCPQNNTNIGTNKKCDKCFYKSTIKDYELFGEAEPSDLISRAEVLKLLDEMEEPEINDYNCTIREHNITLDKVACWVEDLPSVSADRPQGEDWDKYSEKLWKLAYERGLNDRPKGEWKIRDDMPKLDNTYSIECSECGQLMFGHYNADNPNYCPHCGAKMKGGAE